MVIKRQKDELPKRMRQAREEEHGKEKRGRTKQAVLHRTCPKD